MYKIIALVTRKPGMSFEAFKEYYETRHARLARRLLPEIVKYRRNYVIEQRDYVAGGEAGVDAITEFYFESRQSCDAMYERLTGDPATVEEITQDEEQLFDRSRIKVLVVEEHLS